MNLSISLGIIIKNEEQRLFYLLSKLSSYFDETIVINNQSTDKSKIILQQFNSRIIDMKINGDFSALYNLALMIHERNEMAKFENNKNNEDPK